MDRCSPASADSLRSNALPRAHDEPDRRSARKCHVPASTGSRQSNAPAPQTVHRSADALMPELLRYVSPDSCAARRVGDGLEITGTTAVTGADDAAGVAGSLTPRDGIMNDAAGSTRSTAKAATSSTCRAAARVRRASPVTASA